MSPQAFEGENQRVLLSPEHRQFLTDSAIDVKRMEGVRSVLEPSDLPESMAYLSAQSLGGAIVFPWTAIDGQVLPQVRLDDPPLEKDGTAKKYRFPTGSTMVLSVPPGYRDLVQDPEVPLVIVEGTKQHLAAASALDGSSNPFAVLGISGCRGWMKDSRPIPCLHKVPLRGRRVYLAFDADVKTNRNVHDAATQLAGLLTTEFLAEQVMFVLSERSGKDGIDDLLGGHPIENRQAILLRMLQKAAPDRIPGKAPARKAPRAAAAFFDSSGNFLPVAMWHYLEKLHPMAITREVSTEKAMKGSVAVYEEGVYRNGDSRCFQRSITRALGNDYRLHYTDLVTEFALNELTAEGRIIHDRLDRLVVNCHNGLVDVVTGELLPHDPDLLTLFQVPVEYDPHATCPNYETWMEQRLPGQIDALEDVACQVLDRTRTPQKFLFLYGPTRSGKSTVLRIIKALVGESNTSAVTLHQLADDKFAAANLYGKVLNVAADLSSRDVRDLSNLKMLTGEDSIQANRKYGAQFSFTSQALLAFSANEVPTVNDPSGAYQERAVPFHFAHSFAGKEDPKVEAELLAELPGILNRFIRALRAHRGRGNYIGADAATRESFSRQSNRVKEFLDEMTRPSLRPEGTPRSLLWESWKGWSDANGYQTGGRNGFMEKVRGCGVEQFKPISGSVSFAVRLIDPETFDDPVGDGGETLSKISEPSEPTPEKGSVQGGGESSAVLEGYGSFSLSPPKGCVTAEGVDMSLRPGLGKTAETAQNCRAAGSSGGQTGCCAWNLTPSTISTAPMVFDLETRSADKLFAPGVSGFLRLVGHSAGDGVTVTEELEALRGHCGPLVAHNGFNFDFPALARHHGLPLLELGEQGRLIDTMILASLALPCPESDGQKALKKWSLDYLGESQLGLGKSADLSELATRYGGFDLIPVDDPQFRAYCARDVEVAKGLLERFAPGGQLTPYQAREMRLMARLTAGITLQGFRVDVSLVHQRIAEGQQVKSQGFEWLVETYGLPTTTSNGGPAKNPAATQLGKKLIARAFEDMGVKLPRTAAGVPSTSQTTMKGLIESPNSCPEVVRLAEVVLQLNGVRSIYQTVLENLQGDRVHPTLFPCQRNGRFSVRPGMTTFGKRGGRVTERAIFLPDSDDHVLIACDLSQIDARAVAAHCQDPAYMTLFDLDPETGKPRDIHTEVAVAIWGDPSRRSDAKPINHGINYGMSEKKLAQQTGQSEWEAMRILNSFWRKFPLLKAWQESVREKGKQGLPLDNGFGRQLFADPERAHTQAPALVGCGCARDLMMEGLLRLPTEIVPMLRMFVHDEVIFSVPKADATDIEAAILEALQFDWAPHSGAKPIRVMAELGARGSNWAEVYAND